jgi:hypothetical protein
MNFAFRVAFPNGLGLEVSGDLFRDPVECRVQIALCFCICPLRTNEISHTDPLVQVDYVRVVDLGIGRANRTSARSERHLFGARRQPRAGVRWKTLSRPVVRRLITKKQHQGRGACPSTESDPSRPIVQVTLTYRCFNDVRAAST